MDVRCWRLPDICGKRECRYWARDEDTGNCVLRVTEPKELPEIAHILGVSKQAVQQMEQRALKKIYRRWEACACGRYRKLAPRWVK